MATYYRWRKSELVVKEETSDQGTKTYTGISQNYIYGTPAGPDVPIVNGYYDFSDATKINLPSEGNYIHRFNYNFAFEKQADFYVYQGSGSSDVWNDGDGQIRFTVATESRLIKSAGTFIGYVYSTSSSAYPNGGVQDGYYYDQRTTVTSPTAPTGLTYPNPITTPTVTVSWNAASSNTDYPVEKYVLAYQRNGMWQSFDPLTATSREVSIPVETTSILFSVRAIDTNGELSSRTIGPTVNVYLAPTLTVPRMVMQGQQATISWSAIERADSYTLQRKANTDADWTQVYSGANLSYSETVGTWTSLQYRVQAVFDETPGGWATSDPIQIVSASALVISGQDGDLGTLVNDVPYSISSDQTSPTIDVTVEVNGGEYASFQATSGQTYKVGVLDLPTGTGSIVITASTEMSSSPVTVTRTWTYSKTAQTFPNAGGVAQLTKEGAVIWPKTLDEAVRAAMNPWGGNLGTALNLLKNAALFNRTKQPKYSEVTIDLSTLTKTDAQNGKIINLPVNGVMVSHRVVHIGNPDSELYDSSCDGVWVLRENIVGTGAWNTSGVNTLPNSTIMQTMAGYVDDYDTTVQSAIKTVKIPYLTSDGIVHSGASGMECKLFPLSLHEVNNAMEAADGATLNYFNEGATEKRTFNFNGTPFGWWTRSIPSGGGNNVYIIMPDGTSATVSNPAYTGYGYSFTFILPKDFSASYYVDQNGGIHASQEYTEAGDWLDVWGNAIPAVKIETGSYVGTGTYGENNPNTLTFGFEPKLVFIAAENQENVINRVATAPLIFGTNFSSVFYVTSSPTLLEGTIYLQWDKNAIEFYNAGSAYRQLNSAGETYRYVALG